VMLPVQPGASLDTGNTGSGTDGWGIFSGTSAACPQVAGIVALLIQKKPTLLPKDVKKILVDSAIDVKSGSTAMGHAAGNGPDLATGAGLANAKWAWLITMGGLTAEFFSAAPELQHTMVNEGTMPPLTQELINEMISTLRSRV
jgi:serine protease AprX